MPILKSAGLLRGNNNDINPTPKGIHGYPPVFVLPGKSRIPSALVRLHSPLFAATVAIGDPFRWGEPYFCSAKIERLHKESLSNSIEDAGQKHVAPSGLKRIVTVAVKEVAESLRELLVGIAGEAIKRVVWG